MGSVTFRVLLAHLAPGFLPVTVAYWVLDSYRSGLSLGTMDILGLFVIVSITLGVGIDHLKRSSETLFIRWLNLKWVPYWFSKVLARVRDVESSKVPLHITWKRYDDRESAAVRLWVEVKLEERPGVARQIKTAGLLDYIKKGPVTSGNRWALLSIREHQTLQFYARDYFSYYEFGSNLAVATILTQVVLAYAAWVGELSSDRFWLALGLLTACLVIFHELAVHWLLATKRFVGLSLVYSVLEKE